jgi:hypothetical protein
VRWSGDAQEIGVIASVRVSGGPGSCRSTRPPRIWSSRLRSRASARIIDRYTRTVVGAAGRPPRPPEWPGAGRSTRSHRRRGRRRPAGGRAGQRASRRTRARSLRTAGACSRRRPGGHPLGLGEQVAPPSSVDGMGGGEGESSAGDAMGAGLATSSPSTSSSSASGTGPSERCSWLAAATYLRNPQCEVTLNRAPDGSAPRNDGVGEPMSGS